MVKVKTNDNRFGHHIWIDDGDHHIIISQMSKEEQKKLALDLAIETGLLPREFGRLIDADKLMQNFKEEGLFGQGHYQAIEGADTILQGRSELVILEETQERE